MSHQAVVSGMSAQRPLPQGTVEMVMGPPLERPESSDNKMAARLVKHHSQDSEDTDMANDGEPKSLINDGASDGEESVTEDAKTSKKKKAQRFYCTEFPPCSLSFTRSEHLARHIRKHTGERPFQCHCSRRFSRLDNLRQHAQTVHANDDIPSDSLAATGTRFQRQIRTDRVRAPGRGKGSTSSAGIPMSAGSISSRGHSRNVSSSSIGSYSDYGSPDESRRRPPPLAMAQSISSHAGLSIDTFAYGEPGPYYVSNTNASPNGYTTPTSSVFSGETATNSPRYAASLASPISILPSQSHAAFPSSAVVHTHARRLSQPASFTASYHHYHSTSNHGSQHHAAHQHPTGSMYASPSSTVVHIDARQEAAESEWRRRTWHPSTHPAVGSRPATSGLSYYQTPDGPQLVSTEPPAAAQQGLRLPGIDSFDRTNPPPPRRPLSTMEVDEQTRKAHGSPSSTAAARLNDAETTTPARDNHTPSHSMSGWRNNGPVNSQLTAPTELFEEPQTPQRRKREAWYVGPVRSSVDSQGLPRTSPEGSASSDGVPTPFQATTSDYRPAIVHSNGYVESQPTMSLAAEDPAHKVTAPRSAMPAYTFPAPMGPAHSHVTSSPPNTSRLDALVAVATNEDRSLQGH